MYVHILRFKTSSKKLHSVKAKGGIYEREENSYIIDSCKSSDWLRNTFKRHNAATRSGDKEFLLKISISLTPTEYENHVGC